MLTRRRLGLRFAAAAAISAVALLMSPQMAAAQKKPIKIGFSMTLTGGLAGAGKAALIAMNIWRDDINKKGGLLGRKVELVHYDDSTSPAKVPGIYTKLINVDKVDLVVSSYGTNLIAPAMPVVMRKKMVFLALFGLAVNDRFKYKNYFQIMPAGPVPKVDWARGFFKIALAQNPAPKSIALLAADSEFARNAVSGARHLAKEAGMKIVYDKTYKPGTPDFTPIMRAIQAAKPDIVYVGSYPPGSAGMVKAANELSLKTKMFGGGMVGLQYASLQKNLGPMLNGIVNYDFWVPAKTLNFPGVNEFLAKYQKHVKDTKAGVDPLGHYLPPYAYAYLQVLGDAVTAVGEIDHAKLGAYIRKTTFNTVVGPVKFGSNGEWAKTRTLQVQFRGIKGNDLGQFEKEGSRVVLYPESVKSGNVVYPYK
ncbi:MAG: amino acid ABC transporter substrate-binding protein [Rhodospirillales bacterium]|jgi:branched-chain amino acid transport system substrate-binding protein|nr:branched-chain amino acid ABC transporter substrate-binding protein [Rhodospirillaceae bacterium]MDP6427870.1 amino acid ABC transporter substrate-binding protein [Rhodospirillales bacterium]MDP6644435.1 amino acid ABC transporter substrate-binding protein [Rhodospirillales bacterium]MDP6841812.1 amino acid ABC transporter substrate-binding protein [Rhodospirillales bacterium]|tara:strand:- start:3730 stop:4995 length:1266 start_codon:yes stop_codon:yes gene_type:complete